MHNIVTTVVICLFLHKHALHFISAAVVVWFLFFEMRPKASHKMWYSSSHFRMWPLEGHKNVIQDVLERKEKEKTASVRALRQYNEDTQRGNFSEQKVDRFSFSTVLVMRSALSVASSGYNVPYRVLQRILWYLCSIIHRRWHTMLGKPP